MNQPHLPPPRVRTILPLALPAVAGQLFEPLLGVIDVAMLGASGPAALAAVGACAFAYMSVMNLAVGLGQGGQALCARALGRGAPDEAAAIANTTRRLNVLVGVGILVVVWLLAPGIASLLCADAASAELGSQYLRARALGAPFGALVAAWRGMHLSARRATHVMLVMGAAAVVHVILNVIFIPKAPLWDGRISAPAIAALSSAVASAVAWLLFVLTPRPFPMSREHAPVRVLFQTGVPPAIQGVLTALGYAAFVGVLGAGGADAQGAATVLINLAAFAYLVAMGMGTAANTLVGQHLGAGDVQGARRAVGVVIRLAFLLAGPLLLLCFLNPSLAVSFASASPSVTALAALALPYLAAGVAADQAGVVLMMALVAAGKAPIVAATQLGLHWLLLVPGAWFAARSGHAIPGALMIFATYRMLVAAVMILVASRTLRMDHS